MSRLTWNDVGTNTFEAGIDRVVLYSTDGNAIAWNGVQKITEKVEGASITPRYIDGMKYVESRVYGDYSATIEALSYPREFSAHDGTSFDFQGIGFGLQPIKPFTFSYRTLIGNDTDRENTGHYKLHIVYKAYAEASEKSYETINSELSPISFSWDISTVPSRIIGKRPTAHLIIDSRYVSPGMLEYIEANLYGGEGIIGRLTTMQDLLDKIEAYRLAHMGLFTSGFLGHF